jgi:hypothetical protein
VRRKSTKGDTIIGYSTISSATLLDSSKEVVEDYHPLDTSFLVWGKLFIESKMIIAPSITTSLKSLKEHLFHSRDYAQTVGNISKAFWFATTKKEVVEDVLQKSLQEVADLKGQLQ